MGFTEQTSTCKAQEKKVEITPKELETWTEMAF